MLGKYFEIFREKTLCKDNIVAFNSFSMSANTQKASWNFRFAVSKRLTVSQKLSYSPVERSPLWPATDSVSPSLFTDALVKKRLVS